MNGRVLGFKCWVGSEAIICAAWRPNLG